ncbi:MAG: winged helix-turn-helix domain-containing protein [Ruminococcus sp.]|nr:winged helix-turn-helix domain-containing protein [Ruminococcus sp.]
MAYDYFVKLKHSFESPSPFIRRRGIKPWTGLTVISACAGWGKTACLAQLAEDDPTSACISAGAEDNSCERLTALLSEALPEAGIAPGEGGYEAVSKAADALSKGRQLLFDNASLITDSAAQSLLGLLAKAAAAGQFSAVFAARQIPDFLLPFVMNGTAALVGIPELRFTRAETAELAAAIRPDPADVYVNALHSFSGGWCVAAAALARAEGDPEPALDSTLLPRYVSSNILRGLSDDLKDFLLMSSFISDEAGLSREVFGISDAGARLSALADLGIASREGERYPEVLRRILSVMLPADRRKALVERAADHYIRNKRFAEAVALFETDGDSSAAERILRIYGSELLANCEFELIGYCGRIIGRPEVITDPEVLGALAQYHYYSGEYDKMERACNLADSMFGKENKFGVYRMLYKGLLRYPGSPAVYAANIRKAAEYLTANGLPLPFLYQKEQALYDMLTEKTAPQPQSPVLSVYRFGELRLTAGDTVIQCKSRRSLELIAYLLEHRSRSIGREEILSAFWPEDMPANAVAMLHNMIYNLRRELSGCGLENIISYKNKCYSLDMSMIREADSDILSACRCAEEQDAEGLLAHESAAGTYWGSYLGSSDSLWAREKKEYYDRCYINACVMLAEHYRGTGELDRELVFLKNALKLDPYSEQLVGDILVCCSALGKPDKASKYYEEYSARLDADFGTRPSKWLRSRYLSCFSDE